MSGHQYISNPNNLFEDDVDDDTFLANARNRIGSPTENQSTNPFEQQKQVYEQKRRQIESRTLESSQRSLGLLYETEEVGKATASELAKQREQLEKTTRQLDEINATLRFSQKHLNGLKSVFGGLKNYLSGSRDMAPTSSRMTNSPSGSKISEESATNELQQHQQQQQQKKDPISPIEDRYESHPVNRIRNGPVIKKTQTVKEAYEERLDQNLEDMCDSLSRLKGLATDMQGEIESQNDLLDDMGDKMENVDIKIGKQNKQISSMLGKKK